MTKPYRVIVLDDDFAVAALHSQFVAEHPDFEVVAVAHSVAQAKAQLIEHEPDLLLLDLYLPDENGLSLLNWLRTESKLELEVIAVTADRDLKSVRTARQGGVFHYLVKPFTVKQLHERLSDLANNWRQMDRGVALAVDQRIIDVIMGGTRPLSQNAPRVSELPKGLSTLTLESVIASLEQVDADVSAVELGELVGISRVSARRYLDYLAALGTVQVTPKYGAAGRPEHRYRLLKNSKE
ncbi:MAG: response regulator [Microbacteriaceae bacterium]